MQYKLYYDMQEQEARLHVLQGRQLCRDTALGARQGRRHAARARADARGTEAGARGAQADVLAEARVAQAGGAGGGRRRATCGHLGVLLGCALGALILFLTRFDSVLFLSQFLNTVHEPGSSQKFFDFFLLN